MSTCIKYSSQTLTIIEMYSIEYYLYIMHLESRNDSILKFESNLKYQYDAFLTFLHGRVVWTPFLVQFIYIFPLLNGDLDFKDNI